MSVGGPQRQIGDYQPLAGCRYCRSGSSFGIDANCTGPHRPDDPGKTHFVGDDCQPAHSPIADRDSTDEEIIDVLLPVQELRQENSRLRAWAEDEQQKRHAAEDARVEARSALAYQEQEVDRLLAIIERQSKVVEAAREVAGCCSGAERKCHDGMCIPRLRIAVAAMDRATSPAEDERPSADQALLQSASALLEGVAVEIDGWFPSDPHPTIQNDLRTVASRLQQRFGLLAFVPDDAGGHLERPASC